MSIAVMRGSSSATLSGLRGPVGIGAGGGVPSCADADCTPSLVSTVAVAATLPTEERPQALLVSVRAFSIPGGELTSNLKLRRHAVEQTQRAAIDDAYARLRTARNTAAPEGLAFPLVLLCP